MMVLDGPKFSPIAGAPNIMGYIAIVATRQREQHVSEFKPVPSHPREREEEPSEHEADFLLGHTQQMRPHR